jgi:hypothetical protein
MRFFGGWCGDEGGQFPVGGDVSLAEQAAGHGGHPKERDE